MKTLRPTGRPGAFEVLKSVFAFVTEKVDGGGADDANRRVGGDFAADLHVYPSNV